MALKTFTQKSTGLGNNYNLYAYGEQKEKDVSTNKSKVYCEAKLTSGWTNWQSTAGYISTLKVYWWDNRTNANILKATTNMTGCNPNSSYYATWEGWIDHNSDGTLDGYVYATFDRGQTTSSFAPNNGGVATDRTSLISIERASTPSIEGTVYTGTSCTINTNRASSSFTHTLTYSFGSLTGTIATKSSDANITWSIPENFANQIPNASSGVCTITCDTYNGDTLLGTTTISKEITVNTSVIPTISAKSSTDGNTAVSSLSWGVYLVNKSYPVLSITSAGNKGSTITTWYAGINQSSDADYEANAVYGTSIADLNTKVKNFVLINGTNNIKVWVEDSRGRKSSKHTITFTARSYSSPQITVYNVARCKSSTNLTEDDEGTSVKLSAAGNITDVKNSSNTSVNHMYAKTRYRISPSGTWSSLTNLTGSVSGYSFDKTGTNSVNLAGTFSTASKYDIQIYVYDEVSLKESGWNGSGTPTETQLAKLMMMQKSILTGFDLMHFHKSGKSVAFGKKSEAGDNNKWFEIRMDQIRFEGDTYYDGVDMNTKIDSRLYAVDAPIGTIFAFAGDTIPSGYMACDGSAISRTLYAELFAIIGITYGAGDGSTTFNLPNLNNKFVLGSGTKALAATGGDETVQLTANQLPKMNASWRMHGEEDGTGFYAQYGNMAKGTKYSNKYKNNGSSISGAESYSLNIGFGNDEAHNNMPPYMALRYIIKVSRGTATIPSSVTISNADVLQITTNKTDIANFKSNGTGIIESGTGTNCRYTKYADGTLIIYGYCYLSVSTTKTTYYTTVNFPVSFTDTTYTVNITPRAPWSMFTGLYPCCGTRTVNSCQIGGWYDFTTSSGGQLDFIIMGRWK